MADLMNSAAKVAEQKKLIEHMLSEVESEMEQSGRVHPFIESIREYFNSTGGLSPKQIDALKRFYESVGLYDY